MFRLGSYLQGSENDGPVRALFKLKLYTRLAFSTIEETAVIRVNKCLFNAGFMNLVKATYIVLCMQ